MCSVYRPPSSSDAQFIDDWNVLLSTLVICDGEIIICGDVNLHLDNSSNHYTRLFTHSLNAYGFMQNIKGPTHYQGHTLDVFITRDSSTLINDLTVIDPMLCNDDNNILQDHYAIIARLSIEKQSPRNKSITFRKLRDIDLNEFKYDITNSPMLNNSALPLEEMVKNYNKCLSITLDNHAPIICKIITVRKNALWYDNTLLSAKRLKRKLERKWRETKSISDYREYRNQSIAVNKNLETARIKHYNNEICQQQGNSKVMFSVAKKLTGDNSDPVLPHHTDPATLANRFSAFFHDKIQTIKANIVIDASIPPPTELRYTGPRLVVFQPVTTIEIHKLILSTPNKSCDLDPIPTTLVKQCCAELLPNITNIINGSLVSGVFPSDYKVALVRPIIKKSNLDPDVLKNYRPVSNLHYISKLTEKVVAGQIEMHLENNNLLDPYQSGYRKHHSTETAVLNITNDILSKKDSHQATALVSIDLSAAFDLVDHDVLVKRLDNYFGFSATVLDWFKSFLSDRSQCVILGSARSKSTPVLQGVPQGSVLGARLYTLYVRPMSEICKRHDIHYHSYADDTQLYVHYDRNSDISMREAITKLEYCITEIGQWMTHNCLKLNQDKTEWLIFNGSAISKKVTLTVGEHTIEQSAHIRSLGVKLDPEITIEPQIADVCKSAYYHLRRINKIRKYLTMDSTKTLVHSLVTGRLDYCNSLYSGLTSKATHRLQLAQNSAARVITKTNRHHHITPILHELHWLSISKRAAFKRMVLTYKSLHSNGPAYVKDILNWYAPTRHLRSMNCPTLVPMKCRSIVIHNRLMQSGSSKCWNDLPKAVKCAGSLTLFKKQLKTYFFSLQQYHH